MSNINFVLGTFNLSWKSEKFFSFFLSISFDFSFGFWFSPLIFYLLISGAFCEIACYKQPELENQIYSVVKILFLVQGKKLGRRNCNCVNSLTEFTNIFLPSISTHPHRYECHQVHFSMQHFNAKYNWRLIEL